VTPNPSSRTYRARTRAAALPAFTQEMDGIDGLGSMLELQGEKGFLTWRTLRNVRLWAATPRERRRGLFVEGAHEQRLAEILSFDLDREIFDAFAALAEVLRVPQTVDPRTVSLSCTRLARWAANAGMRITALELLHAAALVCPDDPYFALEAGRAARDQARHDLAEAWLARAVVLARQRAEWDVYARSHIALGFMYTTRGSFPAARVHLLRAARRAERHGIRAAHAMAHHDLFVLEWECGDRPRALAHAGAALRSYPEADSRRGRLAYDVAYSWVLQGHYAAALRVLQEIYQRAELNIQPLVLGAMARAAGAERDSDQFDRARDSLLALELEVRSAAAWVNVAHGAFSLCRWEEAEEAARIGLRLGRERGEAKTVLLAETLLDRVKTRTVEEILTRAETSELRCVEERADEFVRILAAL
jgi:tetratricopeptide (TPR) repeat protein